MPPDGLEECAEGSTAAALGTIFENLPLGLFRASAAREGHFAHVNPALVALLEAESVERIMAVPVRDLYVHPEERDAFIETMEREGSVTNRVIEYRTFSGRRVLGAVTARRVEGSDGSVYYDGALEDVTEYKRAERERDRLLAVLEATPDIVATSSPEGRILYYNKGARRVLGLPPEGHNPDWRVADAHPRWALQRAQNEGIPAAMANGEWEGESAVLNAAGEEVAVSQVIIAHYGPDGTLERFSSIMRDIAERKQMEAELKYQASHDLLTGAVNRGKIEGFLHQEALRGARYTAPFSVLLFDLDHFKQINDDYGHNVGDEVLKGLVELVEQRLRGADILARWGGEEFLILAPQTPLEGAYQLAEGLRASLAQADFAPVPRLSASWGVAEYCTGEAIEAFIKRADDALYKAKHAGRNCVVQSQPESARQPPLF